MDNENRPTHSLCQIVIGTIYHNKGLLCCLITKTLIILLYIVISCLLFCLLYKEIDLGLEELFKYDNLDEIWYWCLAYISMLAFFFTLMLIKLIRGVVIKAKEDIKKREQEGVIESAEEPLIQYQRRLPEVNRDSGNRVLVRPDISSNQPRSTRSTNVEIHRQPSIASQIEPRYLPIPQLPPISPLRNEPPSYNEVVTSDLMTLVEQNDIFIDRLRRMQDVDRQNFRDSFVHFQDTRF